LFVSTQGVDAIVLGHRIRHFRRRAGLTLDALGARVGKPAPYLSLLENGKREPRLGLVNDLAAALDVPAVDLLKPEAPNRRAELEIALARAQDDPLYRELGLPYLKPSAKLPDIVLEHLVRLYHELRGRSIPNIVTREEARIANSELRTEMQRRGNHFADVEDAAAAAVAAVGHAGTAALSEGDLQALASHFGFTIHRAADLPTSVRSLSDLHAKRIYIPHRDVLSNRAARSIIVQTLGHFALGHEDPKDFSSFLRQRVEANYFAGAVLMPAAALVPMLRRSRDERDISIEDLKDVFYVSYEMAAHRFTTLATHDLGLRVHFVRSDQHGTVWKAYENDGVPFPKNSVGAIEGQRLCREWSGRRAFRVLETGNTHFQYTDTPVGTFFCASYVERRHGPEQAITVGVRFEDAKYFRGWDTDERRRSSCPDGECCRNPSEELRSRWDGFAWPTVRPDSHLLAAMPVERVPGVDLAELYEFLDTHRG
jgi:predicted transcriptional regulator/DNA-binding XRE family transcriptional regulator